MADMKAFLPVSSYYILIRLTILITFAIDMVLLVGDQISKENIIANTIINWNLKVSHDAILVYWSQFG